MDIIKELKAITEKLDEEKIEYALCGGLAMAIYGMSRATLDIDVMIEAVSLLPAKKALMQQGFTFEAAPMKFEKVKIHRLCKIEDSTGDYLVIDFLITSDRRNIFENRKIVTWKGGPLSVVSPEGLILLKTFRGNGQDQDDIKYLREILSDKKMSEDENHEY
ncbi:MAG: hypothetical protein DRR19_32435 [Candidatus Parabeggiatoa sp. nov. 1]|nr:MAG: hypothetical protein DRR19_32435 [Gammaproteobacteria bacterium]